MANQPKVKLARPVTPKPMLPGMRLAAPQLTALADAEAGHQETEACKGQTDHFMNFILTFLQKIQALFHKPAVEAAFNTVAQVLTIAEPIVAEIAALVLTRPWRRGLSAYAKCHRRPVCAYHHSGPHVDGQRAAQSRDHFGDENREESGVHQHRANRYPDCSYGAESRRVITVISIAGVLAIASFCIDPRDRAFVKVLVAMPVAHAIAKPFHRKKKKI